VRSPTVAAFSRSTHAASLACSASSAASAAGAAAALALVMIEPACLASRLVDRKTAS
jgi:hypothetical protein